MKYRTIVADPPWDHSDGTGATFTVGMSKRPHPNPHVTGLPYQTMTLEQIEALPVSDMAEDDAHLYLWTTNRFLRFAFDVAETWEFKPICVLTWCKARRGWLGGGAFPSDTEFVLFCRRGKLPAIGRATGRWFEWPRKRGVPVKLGERRDGPNGAHSAKPEAFLDLVEQVSPGPYLELFARRQRLGWDTWGNEALNHVEMESA